MTEKITTNQLEEDNSKFESMYIINKHSMYVAAYRIIKNKYTAEDVVHQAFLRVMGHLDKIDETTSSKTRAFLVTIAEHIAIDYYRKTKRENNLSYDEIDLYIYDKSWGPYIQSCYITEAISKLPANYSTVLNLKYKLGYGDTEIAKYLHITESNVRKRISRAKQKLSKILELKFL